MVHVCMVICFAVRSIHTIYVLHKHLLSFNLFLRNVEILRDLFLCPGV